MLITPIQSQCPDWEGLTEPVLRSADRFAWVWVDRQMAPDRESFLLAEFLSSVNEDNLVAILLCDGYCGRPEDLEFPRREAPRQAREEWLDHISPWASGEGLS